MAEALKQEGNQFFKAHDYEKAIVKYSLSIEADGGRNYQLYTNRALARIRLAQWEKVMADCQASLKLNTRNNVKGYYFLSMAQLEIEPRQCKDALSHALQAYELCVALHDKSITNVVSQVLKCKKKMWEEEHKPKVEAQDRLFQNLTTLMTQSLHAALSRLPGAGAPATAEAQVAREDLQAAHEAQVRQLREAVYRRPDVPAWAVDDISFAVMHDPVTTKNGRSYERATILEHLRRTATDPVTRHPLAEADLRPNLQLAQACDEFLRENGWAVDY